MSSECTACHSVNPVHAKYCAMCGRELGAAGVSPATRNVRLSVAAIVSALAVYGVFAATRSSPELENRSFELMPCKAAAMFELLKPQDVKVVVSVDNGSLQITGTRGECGAVTQFAGLITRYQGKSAHEVRLHMKDARRGWTTRRDYKLAKDKANALFDVLAASDVPVLVSWNGKRVRVDANPEDQETVHNIARILRGRRL